MITKRDSTVLVTSQQSGKITLLFDKIHTKLKNLTIERIK